MTMIGHLILNFSDSIKKKQTLFCLIVSKCDSKIKDEIHYQLLIVIFND